MKKTKSFTIKFKDLSGNEITSEFVMRRPTIRDRLAINSLKKLYNNNTEDIDADNLAVILSTVETICEKKPGWYNIDELDETFISILTSLYLEFIKWRDSETYTIINDGKV